MIDFTGVETGRLGDFLADSIEINILSGSIYIENDFPFVTGQQLFAGDPNYLAGNWEH